VLSDAFSVAVPPFDEAWRSRLKDDLKDTPGFGGWEARLVRQIVDLHEMDERRMLEDEELFRHQFSARATVVQLRPLHVP
jgi:hypothetical protein